MRRMTAILFFTFFLMPASILSARTTDYTSKTFVHLFEWKWSDVARECETFLGPNGFHAVQISPPHEHIMDRAWWARYQTVSYELNSRSGTEEEFADMVQRCNKAGVEIYADAVLNHMTGSNGLGFAGTPYEKWRYTDYTRDDFHQACSIFDYHDRWQVQNCDLVGLADLKTESDHVQSQIANYLQKMMDYGVSGFRIDAAKHIPSNDINSILSRLSKKPYIFQEVIDLGGEPIKNYEYYQNGFVTEFKYGAEMARIFFGDYISWFKNFEPFSRGLIPSDKAVVFLDNHDNQRGHGGNGQVLTNRTSRLYALAHVIMLGIPYGHVRILSSYRFESADQGPPQTLIHENGKLNCFDKWLCEHRWTLIANMVRFRKQMAGTSTNQWWSNGKNQLAFARSDKGYVVVNKERSFMDQWLFTGLPGGRYCNMIKGGIHKDGRKCQEGKPIEVKNDGWANFQIDSEDAVVLSVDERLK
jgi:alpha-amylase